MLPKIEHPPFFGRKSPKRRTFGLCFRAVTAKQFFRRAGFDRMRHGQL
jgi:hypothetical protein